MREGGNPFAGRPHKTWIPGCGTTAFVVVRHFGMAMGTIFAISEWALVRNHSLNPALLDSDRLGIREFIIMLVGFGIKAYGSGQLSLDLSYDRIFENNYSSDIHTATGNYRF